MFHVVRTPDKRFYQRQPNGKPGLGETRRVLYHLPELVAHIYRNDRAPIYIVEGEKDVHAIEAVGGTATCNPMGAGKWQPEYSESLQGARTIVIVADTDQPGHAHALAVQASLGEFGLTASIVQAAEGKDAADHLAAGRDLSELQPVETPLRPGAVHVVTLERFTTTEENTGPPLIGTHDDALLPADGLLLMYGDGGAGKTTLSVDAVAHIASGTEWVTVLVPRPVRVMLIENEGPRGPFRRVLKAKVNNWEGAQFHHNVTVLEEPWTRFTLADETYRLELAEQINRTKTELVVVGPLASLGAKGTGTPDDVNEFTSMISDLRNQVHHPLALWIVHHENKAGDVSGAWERVPDTLVHVSAQGNGKTRVHWRKVRWSSRLHNTSHQLLWADNAGFTIDEARERDYQAELLEAFRNNDCWRTAAEAKTLIGAGDAVKEALLALQQAGEMTYQIGPPGRASNAKCWRLRTDLSDPGHPRSADLFEGTQRRTDPLTPPIKESEGSGQYPPPPPTDPDPPGQFTTNGNIAWLDELAPDPEEQPPYD